MDIKSWFNEQGLRDWAMLACALVIGLVLGHLLRPTAATQAPRGARPSTIGAASPHNTAPAVAPKANSRDQALKQRVGDLEGKNARLRRQGEDNAAVRAKQARDAQESAASAINVEMEKRHEAESRRDAYHSMARSAQLEASAAKKRYEDLKTKLRAEIEAEKSDLKKQKESIDLLKTRESKYDELQEQHTELQSQLDAVSADLGRTKAENEKLENRQTPLQEENARLKAELDSLKASTSKQTQAAASTQPSASPQADIDRLTQQLREARRETMTLRLQDQATVDFLNELNKTVGWQPNEFEGRKHAKYVSDLVGSIKDDDFGAEAESMRDAVQHLVSNRVEFFATVDGLLVRGSQKGKDSKKSSTSLKVPKKSTATSAEAQQTTKAPQATDRTANSTGLSSSNPNGKASKKSSTTPIATGKAPEPAVAQVTQASVAAEAIGQAGNSTVEASTASDEAQALSRPRRKSLASIIIPAPTRKVKVSMPSRSPKNAASPKTKSVPAPKAAAAENAQSGEVIQDHRQPEKKQTQQSNWEPGVQTKTKLPSKGRARGKQEVTAAPHAPAPKNATKDVGPDNGKFQAMLDLKRAKEKSEVKITAASADQKSQGKPEDSVKANTSSQSSISQGKPEKSIQTRNSTTMKQPADTESAQEPIKKNSVAEPAESALTADATQIRTGSPISEPPQATSDQKNAEPTPQTLATQAQARAEPASESTSDEDKPSKTSSFNSIVEKNGQASIQPPKASKEDIKQIQPTHVSTLADSQNPAIKDAKSVPSGPTTFAQSQRAMPPSGSALKEIKKTSNGMMASIYSDTNNPEDIEPRNPSSAARPQRCSPHGETTASRQTVPNANYIQSNSAASSHESSAPPLADGTIRPQRSGLSQSSPPPPRLTNPPPRNTSPMDCREDSIWSDKNYQETEASVAAMRAERSQSENHQQQQSRNAQGAPRSRNDIYNDGGRGNQSRGTTQRASNPNNDRSSTEHENRSQSRGRSRRGNDRGGQDHSQRAQSGNGASYPPAQASIPAQNGHRDEHNLTATQLHENLGKDTPDAAMPDADASQEELTPPEAAKPRAIGQGKKAAHQHIQQNLDSVRAGKEVEKVEPPPSTHQPTQEELDRYNDANEDIPTDEDDDDPSPLDDLDKLEEQLDNEKTSTQTSSDAVSGEQDRADEDMDGVTQDGPQSNIPGSSPELEDVSDEKMDNSNAEDSLPEQQDGPRVEEDSDEDDFEDVPGLNAAQQDRLPIEDITAEVRESPRQERSQPGDPRDENEDEGSDADAEHESESESEYAQGPAIFGRSAGALARAEQERWEALQRRRDEQREEQERRQRK